MSDEEATAFATGFIFVWVFLALLSGLFTGLIGYLVGKGKGRGTSGFWLGFLLSLIGILIVAIMEPSQERRGRKTTPRQPWPPAGHATVSGPTTPSDAQRRQYLAEAIARNPELGDSQDPETLRQLGEAVDAIAAEEQLKRDLQALRFQQERDAQRAEREAMLERLDREESDRRRAEHERQQELQRLEKEAEQQRLAALGPIRRWLVQHRALSLAMAGILSAALLFALAVWWSNVQESRQLEAAALAREAVLASCSPAQLPAAEQSAPSAGLLERWSTCGFVDTRVWVAERPGLGPEVSAALAEDAEPSVRYALARNTSLDPETIALLAGDESELVRLTVAERVSLPPEALELLAQDGSMKVRREVAARENLPQSVREVLVRDPAWEIRYASTLSNPGNPDELITLSKDKDVRVASAAVLFLGLLQYENLDDNQSADSERAKYQACVRLLKIDPKMTIGLTDEPLKGICKYVIEYPPED